MNPILYVPLLIILFVLSYQDIKDSMVYDWIVQFGVLLGVGINYLLGNSVLVCVLDAFIGFFALFLVNFIYQKLKNRNGIGMGDAYVFACIGAFLGLESLYFVLLFACIFALFFILSMKICGKKQSKIPFVPFLSIGVLMFLFMELS